MSGNDRPNLNHDFWRALSLGDGDAQQCLFRLFNSDEPISAETRRSLAIMFFNGMSRKMQNAVSLAEKAAGRTIWLSSDNWQATVKLLASDRYFRSGIRTRQNRLDLGLRILAKINDGVGRQEAIIATALEESPVNDKRGNRATSRESSCAEALQYAFDAQKFANEWVPKREKANATAGFTLAPEQLLHDAYEQFHIKRYREETAVKNAKARSKRAASKKG